MKHKLKSLLNFGGGIWALLLTVSYFFSMLFLLLMMIYKWICRFFEDSIEPSTFPERMGSILFIVFVILLFLVPDKEPLVSKDQWSLKEEQNYRNKMKKELEKHGIH